MKFLNRTAASASIAGLVLTAAMACGCASREVKTTEYVPTPPPKVEVQPPPVIVNPPPQASEEPSSSSTSQTSTTYHSGNSDSLSQPGSASYTSTYRKHTESSEVDSVPPPPPPTTTTYRYDYRVTQPAD
jgi:hypothetical protein